MLCPAICYLQRGGPELSRLPPGWIRYGDILSLIPEGPRVQVLKDAELLLLLHALEDEGLVAAAPVGSHLVHKLLPAYERGR